MSELRCTQISHHAGEPLAGTAVADTKRWLVIEHAAPWGPLGVEDSGLPAPLVDRLRALGKEHAALRVQLVRRRAEQRDPKLYFASAERALLHSMTVPSLDALLELPLEAWLKDEAPPPGASEREPLYLVCVHGKRDRCCALLGLPVYRALQERVGERALETTHLGGHRFAATLLVLPWGICYGRVEPQEVEALVSESDAGRFHDLARVRGRCSYGSEAQAAELALRMDTGERGLGAYTLLAQEREGDVTVVRFRDAAGREYVERVRREAMPAMPTSCGAEPKPVKRLVRAVPGSPRA